MYFFVVICPDFPVQTPFPFQTPPHLDPQTEHLDSYLWSHPSNRPSRHPPSRDTSRNVPFVGLDGLGVKSWSLFEKGGPKVPVFKRVSKNKRAEIEGRFYRIPLFRPEFCTKKGLHDFTPNSPESTKEEDAGSPEARASDAAAEPGPSSSQAQESSYPVLGCLLGGRYQ